MKNKLIQFQVSFESVETREDAVYITGYASTPDIDRYDSIITKESIFNGMENFKNNPVLLLQHNSEKPIGEVVESEVDDRGWKVVAKVTKNTDGVMDDIRAERLKGFSIGFRALDRHYMDRATGMNMSDLTEEQLSHVKTKNIVRVITKIEMVELSVVTIPANPNTLFTLGKSLRAYFGELETRGYMERYIVQDKENPFTSESAQPNDEINNENEEKEAESDENNEKPQEKEGESDVTEVDNNSEGKVQGEEKESENDEQEEEKDGDDDASDEKEDESDENSDISTDEAQDEGGNEGESPSESQDESQASVDEVEKLRFDLEEERKLNDEVINDLLQKVEQLQAKIDKRAVNKPIIYDNRHAQSEEGGFKAVLRQAKYGV